MLPQVTKLKDCKTYSNKKFTQSHLFMCNFFFLYLFTTSTAVGCILIKLGCTCTYLTLPITVDRLCVNMFRFSI